MIKTWGTVYSASHDVNKLMITTENKTMTMTEDTHQQTSVACSYFRHAAAMNRSSYVLLLVQKTDDAQSSQIKDAVTCTYLIRGSLSSCLKGCHEPLTLHWVYTAWLPVKSRAGQGPQGPSRRLIHLDALRSTNESWPEHLASPV